MNILRLVVEEKERKKRAATNPNFAKLQDEAASKDKGDCPIHFPKDELIATLSAEQFQVTQQGKTERPFSGKFVHMKEDGIYTCIVCDNPLFKSDQKFDTMCGWPSFSDVIAHGKVTVKRDTSHGARRIEVSCSQCGAHLGHVFDDGPRPTKLRYCINSASLDFKKHTTV
ncbi:Methionine-R-sulfoxide reductase B3 [Lamellibrachia satsuma]|nr:Methionine-R-sulfoxide reductase B3 [Lamellibrachia satsuma]